MTYSPSPQPLPVSRLQKCRAFLHQHRQTPLHGINNALGYASTPTGRGDTTDDRNACNNLRGHGRRKIRLSRRRVHEVYGGDRKSLGERWRCCFTVKDERDERACEDHLKNFWSPFRGEEDNGAA